MMDGGDQSTKMLRIQTISLVGLMLIAVGGVIVYSLHRKQESDNINTMRNYNCGRSQAAVLMEANGLWDDFKVGATTSSAFSERLNNLTNQHLGGVETFCDSVTVRRITDIVKTKYPGLATW